MGAFHRRHYRELVALRQKKYVYMALTAIIKSLCGMDAAVEPEGMY